MSYYKFQNHGGIEPDRVAAIYNSFLTELLEESDDREECPHGFDIHIGLPATDMQWLLESDEDEHLVGCPVIGYVVDHEPNGFGNQRIYINRHGIVEFESV